MPTYLLICLSLLSLTAEASDWATVSGSSRETVVLNELDDQNGWLSTAIRTSKYDKMDVSAFAFYRGTAHLYYRDLDAQSLITNSSFSRSDAVTWLQGDMHVQNFGAFDDDEGDVVYDLNDFDESWVSSYLYDVWRTAISIVLVARENGFSDAKAKDFVDSFTESYLDTVETYRNNNDEHDFKITKTNAYGKLDEFLDDVEDDNSRIDMLDQWTNSSGGTRTFKSHAQYAKLDSVTTQERNNMISAIAIYDDNLTSGLNGNSSYFQVKDVAKRLDAGTGSLGYPRYYVLVEGASSSADDDRILDVKQQSYPAIYPYLNAGEQTNVTSLISAMGCRVATANRAMLIDADDHLGCLTFQNESYSVRERSPYKESFDTDILNSDTRFTKLAEQWGILLASAHARGDEDFDSNLVADDFESVMNQITDGYHSEFRSETKNIAVHYADQVAIDYAIFVQLRNANQID